MTKQSTKYATMISALRELRRDWDRTFAALQKKQRMLIRALVTKEETKKLSSLRRSLS